MDVVYATSTSVVTLPSGAVFVVRGGTHWPADDEVVRHNPSLFSTDARYGLSYSSAPREMSSPPEVETATATPGERRNVRRKAA